MIHSSPRVEGDCHRLQGAPWLVQQHSMTDSSDTADSHWPFLSCYGAICLLLYAILLKPHCTITSPQPQGNLIQTHQWKMQSHLSLTERFTWGWCACSIDAEYLHLFPKGRGTLCLFPDTLKNCWNKRSIHQLSDRTRLRLMIAFISD